VTAAESRILKYYDAVPQAFMRLRAIPKIASGHAKKAYVVRTDTPERLRHPAGYDTICLHQPYIGVTI
jgi:hypothetical protein